MRELKKMFAVMLIVFGTSNYLYADWQKVTDLPLQSHLMSNLIVDVNASGTPYISFINNNELNVSYWDGGNFIQVGNSTRAAAGFGVFTIDNANNLIRSPFDYSGGVYSIKTQRWDGSNWNDLGAAFTQQMQYPSSTTDASGNIYLSYQDHNWGLSLSKWDGSNWSFVGSETFNPGVSGTDTQVNTSSVDFDSNGNIYIVYDDANSTSHTAGATVMKWDGNTWSLVGDRGGVTGGLVFNVGVLPEIVIGDDDTVYVAYSEGTQQPLIVKKWDGTSWVEIGRFSDNETWSRSLQKDGNGNLWVMYDNTNTGKVVSKYWDGTSWNIAGTEGFATGAFGTNETMFAINNAGEKYAILNRTSGNVELWKYEKDIPTFSGGDGTSHNPYQISTLNDLKALSEDSRVWDKYFVQTTDINATDTKNWNSGAGFSPIGDATTAFTGEYYGGGDDYNYTAITNLYINRPTENNIGFFGKVGTMMGSDYKIHHFQLLDVNITGKDNVGAMAGYIPGVSIYNAFASGHVQGGTSVGGFVGSQFYGSLESVHSDVDVVATGDFVGGLAGRSGGAGRTQFSSSRGDVQGANYVGGLIGYAAGTTEDCFSSGHISATGTNKGGLIAFGGANSETSFWDVNTSGVTTSEGGSGVVGKTTAEMQDYKTYSAAYWSITRKAGLSKDYPIHYGDSFAIKYPNNAPTDISISCVENDNLSCDNGYNSMNIELLNTTAQNSTIATFSVEDTDLEDGYFTDSHTFGFCSTGANNNLFVFDGANLKLNSSLANMTSSYIELCVRVTDADGAFYDEQLSVYPYSNVDNENNSPTNENNSPTTDTPTTDTPTTDSTQPITSKAKSLRTGVTASSGGAGTTDSPYEVIYDDGSGTTSKVVIKNVTGKTITTNYSSAASEYTLDNAVASYNNNGTTEHLITVNGKQTTAISYLPKAQVQFTTDGGVQTTITHGTENISVTANADGTAEHVVLLNGVTTKATSKVQGATTTIKADGKVETAAPTTKASETIGADVWVFEAVVKTDTNGKTVTTFQKRNTTTNEITNPQNTFNPLTPYNAGNTVEIEDINGKTYFKTTASVTTDMTVE